MKIGITVHFQYSFFSAGSPQTALSLAEVLCLKGHEIKFVNIGTTADWWEDIKGMKKSWKVIQSSELGTEDLDIVLEVGQHFLTEAQRHQVKKSVWVCRKTPLFHDVEASLFPFLPERTTKSISEVWLFDAQVSNDDKQYLELLTRKPVRLVPYIWTPSAIELYRQETKAPIWQQVAAVPDFKEKPWSVHVNETNISSSSSCTIPMFIMREVKRKTDVKFVKDIKIHNADNVKDGNFFLHNIYDKAATDISGNFLGRQRVIDYVYDPHSIVVSHSRFIKFRPYLFDLMWVGVPFIHNSPFLSELDSRLKECYYPDNDLIEGRKAFSRATELALKSSAETVIELRKKILEKFSPFLPEIQEKYHKAVIEISERTEEKEPITESKAITAKSESKPEVKAEPQSNSESTPESKQNTSSILRVGFCDMWDQFNPEYNMFTLMLENAYKGKEVKGIDLSKSSELSVKDIDIVIFGPFGDMWKSIDKSIPKIHYTGEDTEPVEREDVKLNLCYKHQDGAKGDYLRLPLWMLEIDWFNCDSGRIQNPKPLPIDRVCKVYEDEMDTKKKFCAFVVTNPRQPMRNNAFHWLSEYKKVDSAGRLFNNVGDEIFAGLGGGGGELKKLEFLKSYKFCLTFENETSVGYTTEKMLHAKAAGCIPIYWGDPKVERDFDTAGFIDARKISSGSELIELVKEVDSDDELWKQKFRVPALDEYRRDIVRRTLSECAKRMWRLGGLSEEEIKVIPRFLGDTETKVKEQPKVDTKVEEQPKVDTKVEEQPKVETKKETLVQPETPIKKRIPITTEKQKDLNSTLFVTAANEKFLPCLQIWLQSVSEQKKVCPEMDLQVYLMDDVKDDVIVAYKEKFPLATYHRFPKEVPEGFKDLWEPQHFAWKLWLCNELVKDKDNEGRLIYYMDSGSMMVSWPREWLRKALTSGFCVLEDKEQENRRWCHETFVKEMKMTEAELDTQQIWAGNLAFVGGDSVATEIFSEAWKLAQRRELIVGPKFSGITPEGKPTGHRHDQSILSILCQRHGVERHPLYDVYCDISLRQTFLSGKHVYAHRGGFKVHDPVTDGIDDVWVINLDRRPDRMEKFKKTHTILSERALRLPAFDGKKLALTDKIARLFKPHDFNWKKPVMGCALSHLSVWMRLLTDKPDIQSYLVLEDDVVLDSTWKQRWDAMIDDDALPEDWDIVYLGGILPPNREGFEACCVEKLNKHIARIKENQVFGQPIPNRYMHFCAYAYVLSRRGAQKILDVLAAKDGYWTSADHMICNIYDYLKIYFLHPLVAGCYQDNDPIYKTSAFNDFSRVDSFDSDLWNNKEHFSEEEVKKHTKDIEIDILGALEEARRSMQEQVDVIGQESQEKAKEDLIEEKKTVMKRRFVSVTGGCDMSKFYEFAWFKQLFGSEGMVLEVDTVDQPQDDEPIVVIQRPHVEKAHEELLRWKKAGKKFYILHVSDEFGTDPVDFYEWDECLGVLRNYVRDDVKESEKVKVIPLGFHWAIENGEPYIHTPQSPFREYTWSFVGTGWQGRKEKLDILKNIPSEHKCILQEGWDSADKLGKEESLGIMLNSLCIPCPGGMNGETFRIYEALEAGAIPVLVKEAGMEKIMGYLVRWLPLLNAENWIHAAQVIHTLKEKPELYEQYRIQILAGWEKMKKDVKGWVKEVYRI